MESQIKSMNGPGVIEPFLAPGPTSDTNTQEGLYNRILCGLSKA